jgi:hypothetical protein
MIQLFHIDFLRDATNPFRVDFYVTQQGLLITCYEFRAAENWKILSS